VRPVESRKRCSHQARWFDFLGGARRMAADTVIVARGQRLPLVQGLRRDLSGMVDPIEAGRLGALRAGRAAPSGAAGARDSIGPAALKTLIAIYFRPNPKSIQLKRRLSIATLYY